VADKNTPILENRNLGREGRIDRYVVDDLIRSRGQNFYREGEAPQESKQSENFIYLEEGDHFGITITKKQTVIIGKAGAYFTSPVIIDAGASAIFVGCHFEQTQKNTNALVQINEGGRAVFENCTFRRFGLNKAKYGTPIVNAGYVALNTTILGEQMVVMTGCSFFEDTPSGAANVVTQFGSAVGSSFISYSINQSGLAVGGGVTAVGVLT